MSPSRSLSSQRRPGARPSSYSARPNTRGAGAVRSYRPARNGAYRPPHRRPDHRYARPHHRYVTPYRARPLPRRYHYRSYYSRWYVHPFYRSCYSTYSVVGFGFAVSPWAVTWAPPARPGWVWVAGHYNSWGYWTPGFWTPVRTAPVVNNNTYVYVPGWWQDELYVEGYWRPEARDDGDWLWVEGYYLEDGTYVSGHWRPTIAGPEGYSWEPGFFDGETWVEGFWRPEFRAGYVWVSSWYDEEGIFHTGYWEPTDAVPGQVWIPGWFDGTDWVPGYWVDETEYNTTNIDTWQPEEGWNNGWDSDTDVFQQSTPGDIDPNRAPLALPIEITEEPL